MPGSRTGAKFSFIAGAIVLACILLVLLTLPLAFRLAIFSFKITVVCVLISLVVIGAKLLFRR